MSVHEVGLMVTVRIRIDDELAPTAITRATENHDENGVPRPDGSPAGWRYGMFSFTTEREVLEHLAMLAVNGYEDASRCDGWADLPRDAITMRVLDSQADWVAVG